MESVWWRELKSRNAANDLLFFGFFLGLDPVTMHLLTTWTWISLDHLCVHYFWLKSWQQEPSRCFIICSLLIGGYETGAMNRKLFLVSMCIICGYEADTMNRVCVSLFTVKLLVAMKVASWIRNWLQTLRKVLLIDLEKIKLRSWSCVNHCGDWDNLLWHWILSVSQLVDEEGDWELT